MHVDMYVSCTLNSMSLQLFYAGDYVMGKSPLPRANSNLESNVIYGTRSGQLTQMANGTSLFYEQVWRRPGMLLCQNKALLCTNTASKRLLKQKMRHNAFTGRIC